MRSSPRSTKAASPCSRSFRSRRVRWSKAPYVAFDAGNVDFMFSETLVNALNEVDDAPWSEWLGINDTQAPRCLSQSGSRNGSGPLASGPARFGPPEPRQQRGSSMQGPLAARNGQSVLARPGAPGARSTASQQPRP